MSSPTSAPSGSRWRQPRVTARCKGTIWSSEQQDPGLRLHASDPRLHGQALRRLTRFARPVHDRLTRPLRGIREARIGQPNARRSPLVEQGAHRSPNGNRRAASTQDNGNGRIHDFPVILRARMLAVENVTKRFIISDGAISALEGLSLVVPKGHFVAVIGPSGCGKSTLFNILGGLVDDYQGRVLIDGH